MIIARHLPGFLFCLVLVVEHFIHGVIGLHYPCNIVSSIFKITPPAEGLAKTVYSDAGAPEEPVDCGVCWSFAS